LVIIALKSEFLNFFLGFFATFASLREMISPEAAKFANENSSQRTKRSSNWLAFKTAG
jgi:hypothetical protein